MENTNPKLKYRLAKNALIHFYKNRYWTEEERDFLHEFFDIHDSDRIWKLKMRLLCEENNDMLVAAVIADATDEEREFLSEKYRKDESFVSIGMKLSIHPNGLQKWRDKFLAKIASLLEYKLPIEDIFSRNKVEALIYVLERTIVFNEAYGKADALVLNNLKVKLRLYKRLLFAIKQILKSENEKVGYRVIRTKILNPNMQMGELARVLGVSHTTINSYVNEFRREFYETEYIY